MIFATVLFYCIQIQAAYTFINMGAVGLCCVWHCFTYPFPSLLRLLRRTCGQGKSVILSHFYQNMEQLVNFIKQERINNNAIPNPISSSNTGLDKNTDIEIFVTLCLGW